MNIEGKARTESGCLVWLGCKTDTGYPRARIKGKVRRAHREVYFAENPEADPRGLVIHSCETAACVNVAHLRYLPPGTAAPRGPINMPRGTDNCNGKLTDEQVESILLSRESDRAEADRYGLSRQYVGRIRRGRVHRRVFEELRACMADLANRRPSLDRI